MIRRNGFRWRRAAFWLIVVVAFLSPRDEAWGQSRGSLPGRSYTIVFESHYDGEYRDSLRGFRSAGRGGVRSVTGRWIDSICYYTMLGECHYQMGNLAQALEQYDAALQLIVTHANWLERVQPPPMIPPDTGTAMRGVTWGTPSVPGRVGRFPNSMQIMVGRTDNARVAQQGGVIAGVENRRVDVGEIVRCSVLAMRRRLEILGPVCQHVSLTQRVLAASSTAGAGTRWAQAWLHVQAGMALASAGDTDQAKRSLKSSLLFGGELFHPVTAAAQIELGKLALREGQLEEAAKQFTDAGLVGAAFGQADVVEEAIRYQVIVQLIKGERQPPPALQGVAAWARRHRFERLQASVDLLSAELIMASGNPRQANGILASAKRTIGRRDMKAGDMGVRLNWLLTRAALAQNRFQNAMAGFQLFLGMQQRMSRRQFQSQLADDLYRGGKLSNRDADQLFESVLRDPTETDWAAEPREAVVFLAGDNIEILQHWFQAALALKTPTRALEVAERVRRARFHDQLPLGGRLLALRWILEAPEETLSETAMRQRQSIREKYPKYVELSKSASTLRSALADSPLVPDAPGAAAMQDEQVNQLDKTSVSQEVILWQIALSREMSDLVFPRLRTTKAIQAQLAPTELALVYHQVGKSLHAFMLSRDNYAHWQVKLAARVPREVSLLYRSMGFVDGFRPLSSSQLVDPRWKQPSERLLSQLIEEKQHGFWNRFDQLTVVPDGSLWQLPFELLMVPNEGEDPGMLCEKVQVQYLPFASFIVRDDRGAKPLPKTVIQVSASSGESELTDLMVELAGELPDAQLLPQSLAGASGVLRSTWDQLASMEGKPSSANPLDWSPVLADKSQSVFSRWLRLPWGAPDRIVLPAHETAAASALKQRSDGDDLFLPIVGLMASGVRTILISRWQTGGAHSAGMVRDFMTASNEASASNTWHAIVKQAMDHAIDVEREPRIISDNEVEVTGSHPFFWSGFLVVDAGGRKAEPVVAAD